MESLTTYKQGLIHERSEYYRRIKELDAKIKFAEEQVYEECLKEHGGHVWVSEREAGPYGQRYRYCKHCRIEI